MADAIREGPWVPVSSFASRLRELRYELGLTTEEMAQRCGFPQVTWSNWERGSRPRRMDEVVKRIVETTGVDRDWLMWGSVPTSRLVALLDGAPLPLQQTFSFDRDLRPVP